jgi:hypothetical protein
VDLEGETRWARNATVNEQGIPAIASGSENVWLGGIISSKCQFAARVVVSVSL